MNKKCRVSQLVRMYLSEVVWPYRAGGHALELQKEEHVMLPGQQSPTVEMPDSCSSKLRSELQCKGKTGG